MGQNTDNLSTQAVSLDITHGDSFMFKINCLLVACRVICFEDLHFYIPRSRQGMTLGRRILILILKEVTEL